MDRLNFRYGMLQVIATKFPPKEHLIRFHLCYLVANGSDSQHHTSQRPGMIYPVEKKNGCPWKYPLLSTWLLFTKRRLTRPIPCHKEYWKVMVYSDGVHILSKFIFCYVACINFGVNMFWIYKFFLKKNIKPNTAPLQLATLKYSDIP
jgi:hypothetical protein